jgi:hypothetical protein
MNHRITDTPEPSPRFCAPLPLGLRDDAQTMSWSDFTARYSPSGGPLRLGDWTCDDAQRPATRLGAQARSFRATLALGDRTETATARASGPVAALTAMLHDRGIGVEMTGFHQLQAGEHTATFVRGGDGHNHQWAMGWAQDATESALFAVIACANRLLLAASN